MVILDESAKGSVVAKIARQRVVESREDLPDKECWLFFTFMPG